MFGKNIDDLPPGVKLEYTSFGRKQQNNSNQSYQGPSYQNPQLQNEINPPISDEQIKPPQKLVWGSHNKSGTIKENNNTNQNQQNNQKNNNNNNINSTQNKKPLGGWADDDENQPQNLQQPEQKKTNFLNKFKKNTQQNNNNTQEQNTTNLEESDNQQNLDELDFCLLLPEELEKYQLEQSKINNIVKDGGLRLKQKHEDMEEFLESTKNVNYQILGSMLVYKLLENTSVKTKARTIFAIQELSLKNNIYFQFFKFHQNHIRNSVPIDDFNQQVEMAIDELLLLFKSKETFELNQNRKRELSQTFDVNFQVEDDILGIQNKGQSQEVIALSDSQNLNKFKKQNDSKFPFLKKKLSKNNSSLGNSQVQYNSQSGSQIINNQQQQQSNNNSQQIKQSQQEENLLDADDLVSNVQSITLNQNNNLQQSTGIDAIQNINFNTSQDLNNYNVYNQQQQNNMNLQQQQNSINQQQQQCLPQGYQQPIQNNYRPQPQFMPQQIQYNQLQNQNNSNNQPVKKGTIVDADIFDKNKDFKLDEIPKISEKKTEQCEKAFDFIKF